MTRFGERFGFVVATVWAWRPAAESPAQRPWRRRLAAPGRQDHVGLGGLIFPSIPNKHTVSELFHNLFKRGESLPVDMVASAKRDSLQPGWSRHYSDLIPFTSSLLHQALLPN